MIRFFTISFLFLFSCSSDLPKENVEDMSHKDFSSDTSTDMEKRRDLPVLDEIKNTWKFKIRSPRENVHLCKNPRFPDEKGTSFPDSDWLCTFDYGGEKGVLYSKNSPADCFDGGFSFLPNYQSTVVIKIGEKFHDAKKVVYDFGGGHQNDALKFEYNNVEFEYYHSTFGPGFRKCQPMDCFNSVEKGKRTEGCTEKRLLPIKCIKIEAGKNYSEESFPKTFEEC